jgi:hypothetical protein
LNPIGNKNVEENDALSFDVSASDPDEDNLSFSSSSLPSGATFEDNASGGKTFSWTPEFGQSGSYSVTFSVQDDGSPVASDDETISISVGDVNRPPVLDSIGNRSVSENDSLSIALSGNDPDDDVLSYSASNLPSGAVLQSNASGSKTFSWTPSFSQSGNYSVTFSVSDNGSPSLSDDETVTITVGDVNRPPVLGAIGNRTIIEGETLSITLTGRDPDGDSLSYSASGLPAGAAFSNNGSGSKTFSWTPEFTQAGTYSITFFVSDGGARALSDQETIRITVGESNRPPSLNAIGNRAVDEGETLSIELSGSDPDGDELSYSASNLPTGSLFEDNSAGSKTFSWTPGYTQAGNYSTTFFVTDNGAPPLNDHETVAIAVGNVDRPPTLSNVGDRTVAEGDFLSITLNGSDPDGDPLQYSASDLPTGALFADGVFSWQPDFEQAGNYSVSFTVSDSGGNSDSETIIITVGDVNRPPTLSVVGDRQTNTTRRIHISVSASDLDGHSVSITASGLPRGASFVDGMFDWTPTENQVGAFSVTFVATDEEGGTDTEVVSFTIFSQGDINRDGQVNSIDIELLEGYLRSQPTDDNQHYDIDGDGFITIMDLRAAGLRCSVSTGCVR